MTDATSSLLLALCLVAAPFLGGYLVGELWAYLLRRKRGT